MQPPHKQPNTPAGPAAAAAAAACWSMLMGPVTLRSCVIVRADLITMMARLLWKMAAAVELVDADQQVFTMSITCRRAQPPAYCLSQPVTWLIVSAWRYISPFYVLSNPLQIGFPSESCSQWWCARGTLTRESDWLFVLFIIRDNSPCSLPPGTTDKWPVLMQAHWLSCSGWMSNGA